MGGQSAEREVSLDTGRNIAEFLDSEKYDILPVEVSKEGKWLLDSPVVRQIEIKNKIKLLSRRFSKSKEIIPPLDNSLRRQRKTSVAFIALHGPYGEDGTVQGLLELLGIPYTCSGVLTSALAMNKAMAKEFLVARGILAPNYQLISSNLGGSLFGHMPELETRLKRKFGFPLVVKPNNQGSSVGVSIVRKKSEIRKALKDAFKKDKEVLVEEFIEGREITASILGNKKPVALPLIEIVPKTSEFFDYYAKYTPGATNEICPAPLSKSLTQEIQQTALKIYKVLGCRGVARVDFIVDKKNRIYFLELNTIPGMTKTSLVPQAAAKAGIEFPELLDRIIQLALDKKGKSH